MYIAPDKAIIPFSPQDVQLGTKSLQVGNGEREPARRERKGGKARTCTRDGSHKETLPVAKKAHTDNGSGYCRDCGADLKASQRCNYCHQIHPGPFGWLIKFFHSILAIFKR
jgi:hypothetical protein